MNPQYKGTGIPDQMAAIRQHEPGGSLQVEHIPVPRPGPGQVLVRMEASPINPSDLALLAGGYIERSYPFTPGLEGSGTVVEAGSGLLPRLRLGKRVACSPAHGSDGTWAGYMLTSVMNVAPIPAHVSMEQGSMMLVNPMTAVAFIQLAAEGKHRAIINNAAASSLGKMMVRLTRNRGIPLINVVRSEAQAETLKELGAVHILNSRSPSFAEELKSLAHTLKATLVLDAVTGSQSAVLLDAAPPGSTLVVYARLSGDPFQADPYSLIREGKKVAGFYLADWLQDKSLLFKLRFISRVKKALDSDLASIVNRSYPLEHAEEAIAYYRDHMSDGKVVLQIGS
jgi:NADPH2:quinone reductase